MGARPSARAYPCAHVSGRARAEAHMSRGLFISAMALLLACAGFALAAARARPVGGAGPGVAGPRPGQVRVYRMLARRAGALALVLMLASKCAH